MPSKLKNYLFGEANKDIDRGLLHPSWWNVAASLLCVVTLVAWDWWCWHIGLEKWHTGAGYSYKGRELMADSSPVRYWLFAVGTCGLGTYAFNNALLYAIEAWMRVRRMIQRADDR